jgi:hypothetical protein
MDDEKHQPQSEESRGESALLKLQTTAELRKRFPTELAARQPAPEDLIVFATGINDTQFVQDQPIATPTDVCTHVRALLQRIFTQAIFSYLIVNKRFKCYFWENPSGYKSLTLEKSTA